MTAKNKRFTVFTVKPVLRGHSKRTPKIGFQNRLSHNAGGKYCRMLRGEHSAISLTFIKLPFVIKIFVLAISSGRLRQIYCTHFLDSCSTCVATLEIGFSRHTFNQPLALYCTGLVPWKWFSMNVLPSDDAFLSRLSPVRCKQTHYFRDFSKFWGSRQTLS